MSNYLWKVKAISNAREVVKGMEVEVVKSGSSAKPNIKEIGDAFERKYGIKLYNGFSISNFEIKSV